MGSKVREGAKRLNFTGTQTAILKPGGGLLGILVASSTLGTLKVADAVGTIVDTMSVVAGQFYPMPCDFATSLTITVGGTLSATLFYDQ